MVQFTKPLYLLLLVPLAYYTWRLSRQSLADMSRFRARLALGLRLAIILMLVLSLAGARMVRDTSQQCVVFVLDVSDSVPKARQDRALGYINSALKSMRTDQTAGLVVFGGDASVELAPEYRKNVEKVYSVPTTSQTDISQALGLALASFPSQCAKKIVLLSDGNETVGKAIEQAMLAGSDNVSIDSVPVAIELPHEALLDRMIAPNSVKVGEPFDLKIVTSSKEPTEAVIRILRDGRPAGARQVSLSKGKSVFAFRQSIPKPGGYKFQAVLDCEADTRPENNAALAYTRVSGKPKVLYVEGGAGQEKYLSAALSSSDIEVDARGRAGVPISMEELQDYDAIVLSDVPAWNLAPEQMAMIKSGVKDLGIGFTMVGGENGFGAGGYYDTPIEESLPVDMSIRKTKVLPSLSVIVVMDKSGSMSAPEGGKQKIELANDAAAAVVKLLQPIDRAGVIVCHDFPVTAAPLRQLTQKGPIYREISTIRAEGGGIYAVPSLKMAYAMMKDAPTRQKHVILMADGADVDDAGPELLGIARLMASHKITVTCVAFGEGQNVNDLKATAAAGKGYFYLARYARDLKAIFTKDVMQVSKSLVIEEPFTPRMNPSAPELSGIDTRSAPPLLGYVAASPKSTANVSIASHKNDPVLATWQYGLGRSAAFTSDCKARWSARWLTWPDYTKFWAQVVRSTMRKSGARDFQSTVEIASGVGHVTVDAVDAKGDFLNLLRFTGSVVAPDLKSHPLIIEQTGPGRYEASFDARQVGSYVVNVSQMGRKTGGPEVTVLSIPYPPEYKDIEPNTALLKRLSSETRGRYSPPAADVFARDFRPSRDYRDLWPLLTLLAVLVLPVDVAVRRVALSPELIVELYTRARGRIRLPRRRGKPAKPEQRTETMAALLRTKKEAGVSQTPSGDGKKPVEAPRPPVVKADAPAPPAPAEQGKPPAEPKPEGETTSRLLEAKRRARERDKQG